jgi:uncharacterized damage-inducible protein DinB
MADDTRSTPPTTGDERATLTGFLQYQRDTLAWKCSGLSPGQLRDRAVPPSTISLLGLIRHLAGAERSWFRHVFRGEALTPLWETGGTRGFDSDGADADEAFRVWQEECARSRDVVAAAGSLEDRVTYDGDEYSLRYILAHMIEEYARHNGHADLIRERLDGTTGE